MIRVALVGCGHMGRLHARTITAHPDCQLVTAVDVRRERAEKIRADHGAAVSDDAGDADAVVIATPPGTHAELARRYLAEGRWVLVEKPLATSAADARALDGPRLCVGHLERFNPAIRALGPVRPRRVAARRQGPRSGRSEDVDVVLDLMIHDLDLVLSWAADARVVGAAGDRDTATAVLAGDGLEASLYASRASEDRVRTVQVDGIELDLLRGTVDGSAAPGPDALTCQWQAFLDTMAGKPRVDAGYPAVFLADEVRRAIAGGP